MKNKLTFLLLCLIFSLQISYSQENFFDEKNFITKLKELIKPEQYNEQIQENFKKFENSWNKGQFNSIKNYIIETYNVLYNNAIKPYPSYFTLTKLFNTIEKRKISNDFFSQIPPITNLLLSKKQIERLNNFYEYLYNILTNNILAKSSASKWVIKNQEFAIYYDTKNDILKIISNFQSDLFLCPISENISDSIKISRVLYEYDFDNNKLYLKNGKVLWENCNIKELNQYANFQSVAIDINQNLYIIENVDFTSTILSVINLKGKITLSPNTQKNKKFPQFESYDRLTITKLIKDTQIKGYLLVSGSNFIFSGPKKEVYVELVIFEKNKKVFVALTPTLNVINPQSQDSIAILINAADMFLTYKGVTFRHPYVTVRYSPQVNINIYRKEWFQNSNYFEKNFYYLEIYRNETGLGKVPIDFISHNLNVFCDRILWKKGDSVAYILTTPSSSRSFVAFQTKNYFNIAEYNYFSGEKTDGLNHLYCLFELFKKFNQISPIEYQKYVKSTYNVTLSTDRIKQLFEELSYANFIDYSRSRDLAMPTQKLFDYISYYDRITYKNKKYKDFDLIEIYSQIGNTEFIAENLGINAIINFNKGQIEALKTKPFKLSPVVKLYADKINFLHGNNLYIPKGKLGAGSAFFTDTTGFTFEYQKFAFNFDDATLQFYIYDSIKYKKITSIFHKVNATVFVNDTLNKSNTLDLKQFPKITVHQKSYLYYEKFFEKFNKTPDGKTIYKNVHEFNKQFYFLAEPFEFESITKLDTTISFKGTFYSNILPPLTVTLTAYPINENEYTLGFNECTNNLPQLTEGISIKNGYFQGCIRITDAGLFGNGTFKFNSLYCKSKQFAFLPDYINGVLDTLLIDPKINEKESEDIPKISGTNILLNWKDTLALSSQNKPFSLYEDFNLSSSPFFKGKIFYQPNKIEATGSITIVDAIINSFEKNFTFKYNRINSDKVDFSIIKNNKKYFLSDNLTADINLTDQLGAFYSRDKLSSINFEENNFTCIMDHFLWKIGEGLVNIGGVMPGEDSTNYVTSIEDLQRTKDPKIRLLGTILKSNQDSLKFHAGITIYDIDKKVIIARYVPKIFVADAFVYPKSDVLIKLKGDFEKLNNCAFEFPFSPLTQTKKFEKTFYFDSATVKIKDFTSYSAENARFIYPYKLQTIKFSKVEVKREKDSYSYCEKLTKGSDSLEIDEFFTYKGPGKIIITGENNKILVAGGISIENISNNPFFKSENFKINPTYITQDSCVFELKSIDSSSTNRKVYTTLIWEPSTQKSQRTFQLTPKLISYYKEFNENDPFFNKPNFIFRINGFIGANKIIGEYRIALKKDVFNILKIDTLDIPTISYNNFLGTLRIQGKFDIFLPWDEDNKNKEDIKTKFAGFYRANLTDTLQEFEGMLAIKFKFIPIEILDKLAELISQNPDNITILQNLEKLQELKKNYIQFFNKKIANDIFQQLENEYSYSLPKELNEYDIVFSKIIFKYNKNLYRLESDWNVIVSKVGNNVLDLYSKCKIIYLPSNIPEIFIVFNPDNNKYISFHYKYQDDQSSLYLYIKIDDPNFSETYIENLSKINKKLKKYNILLENTEVLKKYYPEIF